MLITGRRRHPARGDHDLSPSSRPVHAGFFFAPSPRERNEDDALV